jgi:hypothetical protein
MENDCEKIWFVVSKSFMSGKFSVNIIPFKEEDEAWSIIEQELDDQNSQFWLLAPEEYKMLKELLSEPIYLLNS